MTLLRSLQQGCGTDRLEGARGPWPWDGERREWYRGLATLDAAGPGGAPAVGRRARACKSPPGALPPRAVQLGMGCGGWRDAVPASAGEGCCCLPWETRPFSERRGELGLRDPQGCVKTGYDPRSRRKRPPLPPRGPPRLAGEWLARTKEAGWKCGIRTNLREILSPRVQQTSSKETCGQEWMRIKNSTPGRAYWKARVYSGIAR